MSDIPIQGQIRILKTEYRTTKNTMHEVGKQIAKIMKMRPDAKRYQEIRRLSQIDKNLARRLYEIREELNRLEKLRDE